MFELSLDLMPKKLEQRLAGLLIATAVAICFVIGMAVNAFNQREIALAASFQVGSELGQYLENLERGRPLPAPFATEKLQITAGDVAISPANSRQLPVVMARGDRTLKLFVLFDDEPRRPDLISAHYDLNQYPARQLGDLVRAISRQDLRAVLYLPALDGTSAGRLITAPLVWKDRMTEPVVVILSCLAVILVLVVGRMLAHYVAVPFRALAEDDRADLKPWDTEEAVVLQDKILLQQDARAEMLSEQTRMLASISHDLRTPATRLRLRLEQIDSAALRNRMLHDVEEMTQLITASLDFLRFDVRMEEPQQLSLGALLQSLCDDYTDTGSRVAFIPERQARADQAHSIFGGGGEVQLAVEGRAVMNGRPTALRRAFTNLIDNALKYGGAATVRLQSHMHDKLTIIVSDPGPGIPSHLHERVFEPFFRNDSNERTRSSSVGLGLSIVHQVVKAHGGAIFLGETDEGQFCITVELPREA
ncbi:HAMP domain-containing sensor histidine kinase [Pseudovibrio exalbescens]|uniref:sensor histidine kinase n=1 Tax=Pseudovibrio exalbescens TaxID=197461 RepID=UPI00236704D9|nr:HAMP domain-containing sensor histidine kinase [Pseudovibrio exalbescens]MDD7910952.1 HAMP domain-containing sensor histidine kinase [Pseudovibrio exalbescens]